MRVWVISRKKLRDFCATHADACEPLDYWYNLVRAAEWKSFADVRATFGKSVDRYGKCYIFNIHGNHYRLIAKISKKWVKVWVRSILTHSEYTRDGWKSEC